MEDASQGKQDNIEDRDLTIAKTNGLQDALDSKYGDTGGSINGNVSITGGLLVGTTNIITELNNKQDTIEDGDLTIQKTSGLQTALVFYSNQMISYCLNSFSFSFQFLNFHIFHFFNEFI